ncbi:hypothetical protein SARC_01352 [Sphaeroforma arctica JP610]|uniref:Uncharacterized protein n=1 Tax=Sphaeroforma arctica JP610 TaxID=667725 RepID=A0A0L0GC84_9EUKA|nr:hypothetical protein SARC_01352 [Sphaeroforma arctica JP610]KNC86524.1 hypothetical protein SARC_01352 [Sphaeroforma arctica JP610]|eukprot:XP_014160426.1 hypothetical protein SARC_01352 [Sphaeroforma arctica JP610]
MSSVVQAIRLSILCAATASALTLGPTDDIVTAIEGTSDSEVNLESGSYILFRPIVLDRPMSIIGDENGDTLISVGSGIESFIETTLYNGIKLQYITLNSGLGQFQIDVIDPDMRDGELKILSDLGPWYNTRILEDFHIQDCSLSRDMVGNPGREALASPSVYIRPDCRFQIENRIEFQKIGTCGVLRRKEGTVNSYFIKLEASMTEYVTTVYGDTKLRVPLNREGNAVTYISAQIDTQSGVQASISALYQRFSVDCAIIRLERPAVNKDPVDDWTEVSIHFRAQADTK